jgi:glycosyltransferase involved in cell wall biosynthesis
VKVLSVIESLDHGGAETVLVDLVLGLREHAHRVIHFGSANGVPVHAPFVRALRAARVPCADAHWRCLVDPVARARVLAGFRPDVVLFHWWGKDPWLPWLTAARAGPRAARPAFVCVLHHAGARPAPGYDRYVLVAPNQAADVRHLPRARLRRIPNGVDLARFARTRRPAARPRRAGGDPAPMVVGRLSNLRQVKVPADWVRTLAGFAVPGTRFVIAGDGPLRTALEADARALGAPGQFVFPGYVPRDRVPALLASFDVFCYATGEAEECHPLALLEALAAGIPIVAEARGGIPAIVRHERNGLLAGSVAEMGSHLHRLRRDPALRARLARGALVTAGRFSLARQLGRYRRLLRGLPRRLTPSR